jgi:hypothetical protein
MVYAYKENEVLRNNGIIVSDICFDSKDKALEYAKDNGFDAIIEYKKNVKTIWEVEKS